MRTKDQILLEEAYNQIKIQEAYHKPVKGSVIDAITPIEPYVSGRNTYAKRQDDGNWYSVNADDNTIYDIRWMVRDPEAIRKLENHMRGNIAPSDSSSDYTDSKKDEYVENFVHGIQSIVEAKKKELPLALKKAIEKKTGKKFGKKNKDEPTKGFVKLAKKSGKKITSDKVKPKKK